MCHCNQLIWSSHNMAQVASNSPAWYQTPAWVYLWVQYGRWAKIFCWEFTTKSAFSILFAGLILTRCSAMYISTMTQMAHVDFSHVVHFILLYKIKTKELFLYFRRHEPRLFVGSLKWWPQRDLHYCYCNRFGCPHVASSVVECYQNVVFASESQFVLDWINKQITNTLLCQ